MRKKTVFFVATLLAFTLLGCGKVTTSQETELDKNKQEWSACESLKDLPIMEGEHAKFSKARDVGDDCWAIDVDGTTLEEYKAYLQAIEAYGFEKCVDNGENGLDGYVYSATFKKGTRVLSVNYISKVGVTHISIGDGLAISDRMVYKDKYIADNKPDGKNVLTMVQVYNSGNSFVLQLKNGHFIIQDGGWKEDMPYLLDYLDSLVPEGEKPVIEAWFISHDHHDHASCFSAVTDDMKVANRVYVEGFYYSQPNDKVLIISDQSLIAKEVETVMKLFKDSDGNRSKVYRPQIGQRYYFSDVVVEVMYTQEQLPFEQEYELYHDDSNPSMGVNYNDMSTWLRFTIDGQKVIFPGDSGIIVSMNAVISYYDKEYFNVDILVAPHHGSNVSTEVANTFRCKTLLYPYFNTVGGQRKTDILQGTKQLQSTVEEFMCYGDGSKVLTFPYQVGTYETLPLDMFAVNPDILENTAYMIGIDDVY